MQSGDNFRLTVSLMNTTTMASIWSKTYDKKMSASDIFTTQDEIVKNLVQELSAGGFINAAMMKDVVNRSIAKGTLPGRNFPMANIYIRGGQWKNALARLEKVTFPGFLWWADSSTKRNALE